MSNHFVFEATNLHCEELKGRLFHSVRTLCARLVVRLIVDALERITSGCGGDAGGGATLGLLLLCDNAVVAGLVSGASFWSFSASHGSLWPRDKLLQPHRFR